VNLLLDTHLLLWAAEGRKRVPPRAVKLMGDPDNNLVFSAASIWEVAIKQGLGRPDFHADAMLLRRALLDNAYRELAVSGAHAASVATLPAIHKDLFDRILIAQARTEGLTLLTADRIVARYPGPIQLV
jgi:PIN domain nuclease of toxin-antitoxin system